MNGEFSFVWLVVNTHFNDMINVFVCDIWTALHVLRQSRTIARLL